MLIDDGTTVTRTRKSTSSLLLSVALVLGLFLSLGATSAPTPAFGSGYSPSYYPSGPQQNVASSSVLTGGWELCWSGPYNGFAKFSDIFAACDGEYIMYTGWSGVSTSPETIPTTFPVLAAAPRSDVFATTATAGISHATNSNGTKWYFGDDRGAGSDGSQAVGFTDNQSGTPCYQGALSICWHSAPNLPASYGWADGSASPGWAASEAGLSPGWSLGNTSSLGQSPAMGSGANYTRAIFHASDPNKILTFDANEGTGSMSAQSGSSSSSLTSNTFTRTGYTFSGWNSAADGTGTAYAEGATYDFSANLTLYAQWTAVAVTFDSNEGSGSMSTQSGSASSTLTSNTFTRTGYTFAGWNSAADGTGTAYAEGTTYDFSANLTLYAQWSVVVVAPASGGEASEPAAKPVAPARAPAVVVPRRVVELGARVAPVALPRDAQGAKSSQPVALVGGKEVVVKSEAKGSQAARFGAGKFVLDMGVEESDGTVQSVAGMPSVKIARGGSAAVKGSGLQPSSRMQVFLPAADGSFIELPPVLVGPDGSFDAALTFGTPERQRPLPIGKQFIQMFGVDEDGNQTVLEIPVTISQPLPVPEINRVSGERPVLSPGQSVAFNAGTPETVSLSRADETLSVVGEGWSFTVTDSASNGNSENLAFTRDAPMVFAGAGFMPGTRADVWLFSEPTLMGTVDIAADGTFEASFAVDSNFVPTGNHTLQIQGVGDDGFVRAANLGVVVGDLADTPLVPPGVDPFSWLPLILIATALGGIATLVGVMVAMSRRRRLVGRLLPVG